MYSFIHINFMGKIYDDGRTIRLVKYDNNRNPSYQEVIDFLMWDKTDMLRYIFGNFVCNDFNAIVHNNAQYLGFNCRYCFLEDLDCECGHTCLAWDTLDAGRIYTDSTGVEEPEPDIYESYDKLLFNVGPGKVLEFVDIETRMKGTFDFITSDVTIY